MGNRCPIQLLPMYQQPAVTGVVECFKPAKNQLVGHICADRAELLTALHNVHGPHFDLAGERCQWLTFECRG